jgi:hypothetical protein
MRRRALAAWVDTIAALVLANGATLAVGARHERFSQEAQILARADASACPRSTITRSKKLFANERCCISQKGLSGNVRWHHSDSRLGFREPAAATS